MTATTRTATEAELIIVGILALIGLEETQYSVATRRGGSLTVVGLDEEADQLFRDNADDIWEASAKADSSFILETVKGFPILTNRVG